MQFASMLPTAGRFPFATLMDELFQSGTSNGACGRRWTPSVRVHETAETYELHLEIPGVNPDTLEVTLHEGSLTVSGTREKVTLPEGTKVHLDECDHGPFQRSFSFSTALAEDAVEAKTHNGILTIALRKAKAALPIKVQIKNA